jgi:hypothetical protein
MDTAAGFCRSSWMLFLPVVVVIERGGGEGVGRREGRETREGGGRRENWTPRQEAVAARQRQK